MKRQLNNTHTSINYTGHIGSINYTGHIGINHESHGAKVQTCASSHCLHSQDLGHHDLLPGMESRSEGCQT